MLGPSKSNSLLTCLCRALFYTHLSERNSLRWCNIKIHRYAFLRETFFSIIQPRKNFHFAENSVSRARHWRQISALRFTHDKIEHIDKSCRGQIKFCQNKIKDIVILLLKLKHSQCEC